MPAAQRVGVLRGCNFVTWPKTRREWLPAVSPQKPKSQKVALERSLESSRAVSLTILLVLLCCNCRCHDFAAATVAFPPTLCSLGPPCTALGRPFFLWRWLLQRGHLHCGWAVLLPPRPAALHFAAWGHPLPLLPSWPPARCLLPLACAAAPPPRPPRLCLPLGARRLAPATIPPRSLHHWHRPLSNKQCGLHGWPDNV